MIKEMLSADAEISSTRVKGFIAVFVAVGVTIYGLLHNADPEMFLVWWLMIGFFPQLAQKFLELRFLPKKKTDESTPVKEKEVEPEKLNKKEMLPTAGSVVLED